MVEVLHYNGQKKQKTKKLTLRHADSLSNKPKNIHKHTHVCPYHIFKKLQNVILLFIFSSRIIKHCLEFTPWFLYKSIQFYNMHESSVGLSSTTNPKPRGKPSQGKPIS